jgi:putative Ca2+/H+ antiporter (TMEM165/GDT1 family)
MKMGVAVLVGQKLATLSPSLIAAVSAITFFATAAVLYLRGRRRANAAEEQTTFTRGASVSFAAIFLTEWADIGQLTAAMLVARFGAPLLVWSGATMAMMTKAALALALAAGLRKRIQSEWLRYGACATCVILGVLAALRVD